MTAPLGYPNRVTISSKRSDARASSFPAAASIPSHWETTRLKRIADLNMGSSPPSERYNQNGEGLPFLQGNADFGKEHPTPKTYCVEPIKRAAGNDLLLSVRAPVGAVNIADQEYGIGRGLCAISSRQDLTDSRFVYFVLLSVAQPQLEKSATGSTYEAVSTDDVGRVVIPFPDNATQHSIAQFLQRRTSAIDDLIAKKERLIELLVEKRAALITKAVTKGLDPDVDMKDSGVEWLGEIPEHWDVALLDKLIDPSRPITYGIVQPGDEDPDGILMVRGQNYSNGWESTEKIFRVAPEVEAPYRRARMSEGDVVMTIVGAGTGNVAVVPRWLEGANITQTTARLAFDPRACSNRFFFFLLQSSIGHANVDLAVKGAAQPGLNLNHIAKFRVVCPPRREQQRIADFLDGQTTTIDSLIERVRSAQELLVEYRSALITAAVTGKIDVRDHAA